MSLVKLLALPKTQDFLRYQKEVPWDRSARFIFTDYLREHNLDKVADCVQRSLEESSAVLLPSRRKYVYDGWVQTPVIEIYPGLLMKFCWIPPGKFILGFPREIARRGQTEFKHEFETTGFWLGKYPVMEWQWNEIRGRFSAPFNGSWTPVVDITWNAVQKFLEQCAVAGFKVRLPHEYEWEYACRGGLGNKRAYYWGDLLNGDKANCCGVFPCGTETKGKYLGKTTVVGSYEKLAPHPWGLCDMHGNVSEWCDNLYIAGGRQRVIRGGSWYDRAENCRSVSRAPLYPQFKKDYVGFRVALIPSDEGN